MRKLDFTTALLLSVTLGACSGVQTGFDRVTLETQEDDTESFANQLLELSVELRDSSWAEIGEHFAEELTATELAADLDPPQRTVKWVTERPWATRPERATTRNTIVSHLERVFDRYAAVEDVRLKVKSMHVAADGGRRRLDSHIKFFIVARNERGQREWVKGLGEIGAVRQSVGGDAAARWRIDRFKLEDVRVKTSDVDLFSDVTFPAGVSARFPDFGEGANQGFVSHGAAVADVNLDGWLDLAATGVDRNYLYLNDGKGAFDDAGESSLVKFAPIGSGALFLDYDNDGDPDLFLAAVGKQVLLENRFVPDGEVTFRDVSGRSRVDHAAVGFSAVAADVNADGLPDVYVCSYNRYGTVMPDSWTRALNGTPNLLLLNRGDGTFEERAADAGVADSRWSYAAQFVDVDGDGDQDLYVANDFGENGLYMNDGRGVFTDAAAARGVVDAGFGMGVWFEDYDNDGDLDLHVTNMSSTAGNRILELLEPEHPDIGKALRKQAEGNSLYENLGDGTFRDVTRKMGGLPGGWSFGGGFFDFDNDGWSDVYAPNGFISGKSMKDT